MTCKTCFYYKLSDKAGRGNCRFNPPSVQFMPVEVPPKDVAQLALPEKASRFGGGQQPGLMYAPFSALPMVLDTDFCHNYTDKKPTN